MQSEVPAAWWQRGRWGVGGGGGYIWRAHQVSVAQAARVTEAATSDYTYLPLPREQGAAVGTERKWWRWQRGRGHGGDRGCVCLREL